MIKNKYKVLLVEDEANIRNLVATMLETSGYQTLIAESCSAAKTIYNSYIPDLIILDLGLPDMDGMVFLEYVRKASPTPIIVLSARSTEKDKVAALDMGANDYVTKPFSSAELLARVRSTLRSNRYSSMEGKLPGGKFTLKELEIDYDARQVFIGGEEIKLTLKLFSLVFSRLKLLFLIIGKSLAHLFRLWLDNFFHLYFLRSRNKIGSSALHKCGKLIISAHIVDDSAVFHHPDSCCETIDEVTVMGNEEHCLCKLIEGIFKPLTGRHIEMVGRFVQEECIYLVIHKEAQTKACLFTARKNRNFLEYIFTKEAVSGKAVATFARRKICFI